LTQQKGLMFFFLQQLSGSDYTLACEPALPNEPDKRVSRNVLYLVREFHNKRADWTQCQRGTN